MRYRRSNGPHGPHIQIACIPGNVYPTPGRIYGMVDSLSYMDCWHKNIVAHPSFTPFGPVHPYDDEILYRRLPNF